MAVLRWTEVFLLWPLMWSGVSMVGIVTAFAPTDRLLAIASA